MEERQDKSESRDAQEVDSPNTLIKEKSGEELTPGKKTPPKNVQSQEETHTNSQNLDDDRPKPVPIKKNPTMKRGTSQHKTVASMFLF